MSIPANTMTSFDEYVEHRRSPGGFLLAVLENNLTGSISRADAANLAALPEIVRYVVSRLPAVCHGSRDAVDAWLAGRQSD